jgi:hypothetical protein
MGFIRTNMRSPVGNEAGESLTLWQKIARSLDPLAVEQSHRAVPAIALRRASYQHDRCRRLMHQGSVP